MSTDLEVRSNIKASKQARKKSRFRLSSIAIPDFATKLFSELWEEAQRIGEAHEHISLYHAPSECHRDASIGHYHAVEGILKKFNITEEQVINLWDERCSGSYGNHNIISVMVQSFGLLL